MAIVKLESSHTRPQVHFSIDSKAIDVVDDNTIESSYQIYCELYERFLTVFDRFHHANMAHKILIAQTNESTFHLSLLEDMMKQYLLDTGRFNEDAFIPSKRGQYTYVETQNEFVRISESDTQKCDCPLYFSGWTEMPSLFGTVHQHGEKIQLSEGVLHQLHGGYLVLTASTLLSQPLMFIRLLKVLETGMLEWLSPDETRPYPVPIASMPLAFKLVIVAERDNIENLLTLAPHLQSMSFYTEIEPVLELTTPADFTLWQAYVNDIAKRITQLSIDETLWYPLHCYSTRMTGAQDELSLCPKLWTEIFSSIAHDAKDKGVLDAELFHAWRLEKNHCEGYLAQRIYTDFVKDQIYIDVEGQVVGQINGLAVLSYPGHPDEIGEPSRITCIVHLGDGEVNDIERKVELGGNIHAKGLLIMQAFLFSSLKLTQPFPLSASIVFEQSYSEVDGDSASLAELCALISAIAEAPIDQQIAITGSVDQFGQVQPIGGVNEKIEGFFTVCLNKGLTGKQGVIIPQSNVEHLSLNDEVFEAISKGDFHLWAVDHVTEAIELLTSIKYCSEDDEMDLLTMMQQKILQSTGDDTPLPWYKRMFSFSN